MPEPLQRPNLLQASLVPESPCLFLALSGELDLSSAEEVPLDDYSSRPDLTTVLVDLGELRFCDLAGLRALVNFRRIHETQGRDVAVVRASSFIWRFMHLCGVTDRLEVAPPATTAPA